MKKRVLVLNGQYAPGYKGGGPIQSCINMVENLYEQIDFFVLLILLLQVEVIEWFLLLV